MADIHALEIEFAKNAALDACIPLCEAYLAQKRFMEAMVVCKKGIKGAPLDPRGRAMLARVYNEQGKAPKAQQELDQALIEIPNNPLLLDMMGVVLFAQGKRDEAIAKWQAALAQDPNLASARDNLAKVGVVTAAPVAQAAAAPPPPAAPKATPAPAPRPAIPGAAAAAPPPPMRPPAASAAPPLRAPAAPVSAPPPMFAPPAAAPQAPPAPQPMARTPTPAPAEPQKSLEHVSDFFSQEALGFSNDSSGIETAGPGRLTILGFVPTNKGSIKKTAFIAIGVLALAAGVIGYQYKSSQETREIVKRFGDMKLAIADDKSVRYRDAIRIGQGILTIDSKHNQTLSAMAYSAAVLAVDDRDAEQLPKAKEYLALAEKTGDRETDFRVAAKALVAYAEKDYEGGLAGIKKIQDGGGSGPLLELEAFRLWNAAKPDSKEAQVELRRLIQSLTSEARAYTFLGWYFYGREEWEQADKNFSAAVQNVRGHPSALVGLALVDLDRGIGLSERQKEVEKNVKAVMSLPEDEISVPVKALAHFARAQLLLWQNKPAEAKPDYEQAFKLDPDNALLYYRLGVSLLNTGAYSNAVDNLRKAAGKAPNNVRYLRVLADAQIKNKQFDDAKATLDRAAQMAPTDPDVKILQGHKFRAEKKYAEAIAAYKLVARDMGGTPYSLAQLGISSAMRESGKKAEAVLFMQDFLSKAPADVTPDVTARAWCELGLDLEAKGEKETAIESYNSGIEQYRYYADCHYFVCRAAKGPESVEACKAYVQLSPRGEYIVDAKRRAGI